MLATCPSVIQGSGLGPASFLVTAANLHPIHGDNCLLKLADATYLIVPAFYTQICLTELANIQDWAAENNLQLNLTA